MQAAIQLLFYSSIAGSVGAIGFVLAQTALARDKKRITQRLSKDSDADEAPSVRSESRKERVSPLRRIGLAVAKPFLPSQDSDKISGLRKKFAMAGIYDPGAIKTFVGFKFMLLLMGGFFGYMLGIATDQVVIGLAGGALIGYLLPTMQLSMKIKKNQRSLNVGLPDALDLMVICVESGLTIDGTLQRVGEELAMAHPSVSREFGITHTETRLGVARPEAFKNLASRTGNSSYQAMVAMLVQAERFGTSIGTALRVLAEGMRVKRQYAAEEMASKASVKMTFPLVLCVFPATLIVLGGPIVIKLMASGMM